MRASAVHGLHDLWVVLPVRGEAAGKTRLASALDPVERMRLNRALLRRTLAVIEDWQGTVSRCIVVSRCARSLRSARKRGALALAEPLPGAGLNRAAALGMKLARRHGARTVLVLPSDLALLRAASLRRLHAAAQAGVQAAIAADAAGSGTNALLLPAAFSFDFSFGPGSFARHFERLRVRGWEVAVCDDPRLRFDLDTPEQLTVMRLRKPRIGEWRMV